MKKTIKGFMCLMILFATCIASNTFELKAAKSKVTYRMIAGYKISGYVEKIKGKATCMTYEPYKVIEMWSSVYARFASGGDQISSTLWYYEEAKAVLNGTGIPINVKGNHYAKGYGNLVDWSSSI